MVAGVTGRQVYASRTGVLVWNVGVALRHVNGTRMNRTRTGDAPAIARTGESTTLNIPRVGPRLPAAFHPPKHRRFTPYSRPHPS